MNCSEEQELFGNGEKMTLSWNRIILNGNFDIDTLYECGIVSSERNTYIGVKIHSYSEKIAKANRTFINPQIPHVQIGWYSNMDNFLSFLLLHLRCYKNTGGFAGHD